MTPTKAGYTFDPVSRPYTNVGGDMAGENYAGTISNLTVQFATTNSTGSESVSPVEISVTLSGASSQTVTVDYSVTGGTATGGGVDYTLAAGTLTFSPGDTTKNIQVTIVDDSLDEDSETVVVTLSNPANATLGAITSHTYTIKGAQPSYTIGGAIYTDPNNPLTSGLEGVTVTVSGDSGTYQAITSGTFGLWQISDVNEGTYTVYPQLSGWGFKQITNGEPNRLGTHND